MRENLPEQTTLRAPAVKLTMKTARKSFIKGQDGLRRSSSERAEALTEALEERRQHIEGELNTIFRRIREEDQPDTGDAGDRAVSGFERELRSAQVDRLTQMLRQIEEALCRLAEGRFGRCVACNAEIPVARLQSLPFALNCRDCQEAAEEGRIGLVRLIA
jgi:RNA polymerase-binding transcription factor